MARFNTHSSWHGLTPILHGKVQHPFFMAWFNTHSSWHGSIPILHGMVQHPFFMAWFNSHFLLDGSIPILHGNPTNHIYLINIKLTRGSHIFTIWDLIWDAHNGTMSNIIHIVKECCFCNGSIILIWYWFFYQLIMSLEDENNIYLIFYFLHVFDRKLIIVSLILVIHEILRNSHPFT